MEPEALALASLCLHTHLCLLCSGSAFPSPDGNFYNQGIWSEFHSCGARTAQFWRSLLLLLVLTYGFVLGAEKMDFGGLPLLMRLLWFHMRRPEVKTL